MTAVKRLVPALLVVVAFVFSVNAWLTSDAKAQTSPSFATNVKNASTAAEAWGYAVDRAGSASNLDGKLAAAAKMNGLGMNALRTEAPAAAKLLTKRAMVAGLLPRAAMFLGPVGMAVGTGYFLCSAVVKCFGGPKPAPPAVNGLVPNFNGTAPEIATYRKTGSSGYVTSTGSGNCNAGIAFPTGIWTGLDVYIAQVNTDVGCGLNRERDGGGNVAAPASAPAGFVTRFSTNTPFSGFQTNYVASRVYTITKDVDDDLDIKREDSCPAGKTCGTLPEPDDAVWPKQLRDATSDANDVTLTKRLLHELYPSELSNPYVPEVTVPKVQPGETAAAYMARLADLGLVGKLTVSTDYDTRVGPDGIVSVSPAPGTKRELKDFNEIRVRANPSYAPSPAEGSSVDPATGLPVGDPATPGGEGQCLITPPEATIDTSPFSSLDGNRFPFSLVTWMGRTVGGVALSSDAAPPDIRVSALGQSWAFRDWWAVAKPFAEGARWALLVVLYVSAALFLYYRTIGR